MTRTSHAKTHVEPGEDRPAHLVKMYNYMESYLSEHGYPPTVRELTGLDPATSETYQKGFASSTSVIRFYLARMQDFGMIEVTPRVSRGIKLIPRRLWPKHATAKPKSSRVESE